MPERLYSTYQVADLLGTSPAEVAEWIERGWLPFRRSGNGPVRISARGLLNFLEQRGIDIRALVTAAELREEEQVYAQASPGPALPVLPAPDRARTEGASGRQRSSSRGPAWQVVEAVLDDAVARGAGDIHLELRGQRLTLLLQVDGVLREKPHFAARLPEGLGPEVMRDWRRRSVGASKRAGSSSTQAASGDGSGRSRVRRWRASGSSSGCWRTSRRNRR